MNKPKKRRKLKPHPAIIAIPPPQTKTAHMRKLPKAWQPRGTPGDQRDLWMAAISIGSAHQPHGPVAGGIPTGERW